MTAEALQKKKKKCPIIETLNDSFTVNCSLLETVDIEQPHFSHIPQLFTLWFTAGHRGLMGYQSVRYRTKSGGRGHTGPRRPWAGESS